MWSFALFFRGYSELFSAGLQKMSVAAACQRW